MKIVLNGEELILFHIVGKDRGSDEYTWHKLGIAFTSAEEANEHVNYLNRHEVYSGEMEFAYLPETTKVYGKSASLIKEMNENEKNFSK